MDLGEFRLEKLKGLLKNSRMLPSQQILQEDIDKRFTCLKEHGIENLAQLQKALKSKRDVQSFAEASGVPVNYLTVLRREVNSYQPKPINLKDFPGVQLDVIQKLELVGIKNTKQLFEWVITKEGRKGFANQYQITYEDILELTKLTDVARMKWVGPKFARLLVESNYDTVEKVASSDYEALYQDLLRTNEEKGIYKGKFGLNDMKLWVMIVIQDVPQVIQY